LLLTTLIVAACLGCRPNKQSKARDAAIMHTRASLERIIEENRDPKGRAKEALAKLDDGIMDYVPFPIHAALRCKDSGEALLILECFDEDRDLRGIHIWEKHTDPNGAVTTIEEYYPVYVAWPETLILWRGVVSVEPRNANQRKDEDAWKDYVILVLEDLVRKFVYKGPVDEREKLPPTEALNRKMPPIWISVPEANRVAVFVSVYDSAGHESGGIEVDISPWTYDMLKGKNRSKP